MTSLDTDLVVRIAGRATIRRGEDVTSFSADDQAESQRAAEGLPGDLQDLRICTDGTLEINLVGGIAISVPPDTAYEAWEVWEGGRVWVGLPGGGVG